MSESDGVDEVVGGGVRVAITAAGLVAERLAEARVQRARQAEAASVEETRRLEARLTAERAAARAQLTQIDREGWWDNAGVDDVADAWETAQAWRQLDPAAERAAERIEREVRDRYGVDVHNVDGLDRATPERAAAEREAAGMERRRARQAGEDLEAALLLASTNSPAAAEELGADADPERTPLDWGRKAEEFQAAGYSREAAEKLATDYLEWEDRDAAAGGSVKTPVRDPDDLAHQVVAGIRANAERDVTGRRADLAKALAGVNDHEAVEARLQADVSAGRPARDAVTMPRQRAPKARKDRGAGVQVRQRGLGR
ncbi:hypothetical protein GCU67_20240 [Modestobacter muralis]|uniref:Colicin import membrane protein n=1 Tax=Modestobacter muralis TaxID=1608614 RepID=A0A6P0HE20_9ACTN|nr:hypothetical protein [Modestobacter muralis]NEK96479.1 hypothetical protein [Modestobacter muralis]NEN53379.1 hypothetical protein [Modestobacter muralis]